MLSLIHIQMCIRDSKCPVNVIILVFCGRAVRDEKTSQLIASPHAQYYTTISLRNFTRSTYCENFVYQIRSSSRSVCCVMTRSSSIWAAYQEIAYTYVFVCGSSVNPNISCFSPQRNSSLLSSLQKFNLKRADNFVRVFWSEKDISDFWQTVFILSVQRNS